MVIGGHGDTTMIPLDRYASYNGIHIGEDLYENDGFIVHFFSEKKIKNLSKRFNIIEIEKFEEGSFPRKLFRVVLEKKLLTR